MKKVLISSGIILVVVVGVYYFTQYSNKGVSIEIVLPNEEVEVGAPFDVDVMFKNETGNSLGEVKIVLDPSRQIVFEESGTGSPEERELGEIGIGVDRKETFRVVALPAEEQTYKISATIFYSPTTLVAKFKKNEEVEVRVKRPDFELELEAPEQVFPGEEFEIKVKYEIDDEVPELAEFEVHIDHPSNFEVVTSKPETIDRALDGVKFSGLEEGDGEASIRGKIELPDSSEFQIKARLVMKIFGEEYTFMSETKNIMIGQSPLSFQVLLGEHEDVIRPGDELIYVISYRNNTDVPLKDVVIRAQLLGEMFDYSTLETNGRFVASNNTVIWDGGNVSELRELSTGEDGSASIKIEIKDKHPIQTLSDKNFNLVVDAKIESPTVSGGVDASKTVNASRVENKVAGLLEVKAGGYFRDAKSGILNSGPFPPRVGVPTNYTIHWTVTNYGTDVDGVEVRARLGSGVKFTGKTGGNTTSPPRMDESTGEVVWQVGRLLATAGILSEKPEAIFQIAARPASSDIDNYMLILEGTEVHGRDEFTDLTLTATDAPVTTRLEADKTVNTNDGKVIQ